MDPMVVILLVIGGIGLIVLGIWAARAHAERERQRLAGLALWASRNGFSFSPQDPWNLDSRYNGVADIGKGHDRYALEVLTREKPVAAAIFRYHYKTWETRTVTRNGRTHIQRYEATHWRRYLCLELDGKFPGLFLRGEGLLDRIAGFVGFDDIDFESEEFSKRYFCKSDDRQFAYAIIHPQMMEWMLGRQFAAELRQGLLVMDINRLRHDAAGCQEPWADAAGFVNRIPAFVWQDYGHRPPVTLPEPIHLPAPMPAALQSSTPSPVAAPRG